MSVETRSLDELNEQTDVLKHLVGRKIKHVKAASFYRITGFAWLESEMKALFIYETLHRNPTSFARPVPELFDGRFDFL